MASASKTRADIGARTLTGMTIVAAVFLFGGAERAWAQSAPAPIIYAKAAPNTGLQNRADIASVELLSPAAPNQFQARSAPSASDPIDLRPGAMKASFGTAAPVANLDPAPKRPSGAIALAEPYAGPPYQVDGKWYVPAYEPNYDEVGIASWYGPTFHGKAAASGEVFDENAMTAAHPTLPIPSLVRVTNLENGKSVIVRLNDRGPFVDDRIIDLSKKAGAALGMQAKGTARVRVQYVGPAPAAPNAVASEVAQAVAMEAPLVPAIASQPESAPAPSFVSQPLSPVPMVQPVREYSQSGYFLQAGSFADLGNAHALRDKLRGFGPVSVVAANVNGSEFYRVMVGPWPLRPEAERVQSRLVENGAKAIVVSRLN